MRRMSKKPAGVIKLEVVPEKSWRKSNTGLAQAIPIL